MRPLPLVLAACLIPVFAGSALAALAARSALGRLPSAVAIATPGTGSAPILSAGLAGGAAMVAMTRKRSAKRTRGPRLGATGAL